MNSTQIILNYCLNRFCPFLVLAFLLFSNFLLTQWELYAILASIIFIDRFQFKVGYSVGYCEAKGIDPMDKKALNPKKNIKEDKNQVDDRG